MKVIGITGGVGAGKTQILNYLEEKYQARILMADQVAHIVKEKGQSCYEPLVRLLGRSVLDEKDQIDKGKMAAMIFSDQKLLLQVNHVIHPEVKKYILGQIEQERKKGRTKFFFLEAALLIEEHYDEICDELWYIYAEDSIRISRLMESRGYSRERTLQIMKGQLLEEEFRKGCQFVIDNSGKLEEALEQIDRKLGEYL
ncbi:MAG: dephospho-CoA kinase [Roseburia sp.]|nr:dephospho-CoA kinase [Roseburia sp.]MCM1279194.1 dephospho-CoA kinase [Robinsoniella sp.]